MSKRGGESNHAGKPRVKKRKGVKIRSTLIPDSDEDNPPSNVKPEYVRWVKTRVTASGQVGSVTASSVELMDLGGTNDDPPLEFNTEHEAGDVVLQGVAPKTSGTRRKKEKANDSVSYLLTFAPLSY